MKIWKNLGFNKKDFKSMDKDTIIFLEACNLKSNPNSPKYKNTRKKILQK